MTDFLEVSDLSIISAVTYDDSFNLVNPKSGVLNNCQAKSVTMDRIKYDGISIRDIITGKSMTEHLVLSNWVSQNACFLHQLCVDSPIKSLTISNWNMPVLTDLEHTCDCGSMEYVKIENLKAPILSMNGCFMCCSNLNTIDFVNTDLSKVKNLSNCFKECRDLKNINGCNLGSVYYMSHCFYGCRNMNFDKLHWKLDSILDLTSCFSYCTDVENFDFYDWDLSEAYNFGSCFKSCKCAKSISFNPNQTIHPIYLDKCFKDCSHLEKVDLSMMCPDRLKSMRGCFKNCQSLTEIKMNYWNFSNIREKIDFTDAFKGCKCLSTIRCSRDTFDYLVKEGALKSDKWGYVNWADPHSLNGRYAGVCRQKIIDDLKKGL